MPHYSIIIQQFLLIIAYFYYFSGIYSDIKTRKFRNRTLFSILFIGLIFSMITQGWNFLLSLVAYGIITYISLLIYEKNIIGAADLKVLSTVVFFVNIFNFDDLFVFLMSLLVSILVFTVFYLFKKNGLKKESWKMHFKKEGYLLKELIYFKKFNDKVEVSSDSFSLTVPYTVPVCASIIISTFYIYIIR